MFYVRSWSASKQNYKITHKLEMTLVGLDKYVVSMLITLDLLYVLR